MKIVEVGIATEAFLQQRMFWLGRQLGVLQLQVHLL